MTAGTIDNTIPGSLPPGANITPPARLLFLDGIRGLAALYVVLFHVRSAIAWTGHTGGLPKWAYLGSLWIGFGRYSVAVFIVLSGYSLMLPVARSASASLSGGFRGYMLRRARRIIPPYYAALLGSIVVNAAVVGWLGAANITSNLIRPDTSTGGIVSHLLLIHNFSPAWLWTIDFPMWSVATEWQIYFAFPLLIWLWKRATAGVMVLIALGTSLAPALAGYGVIGNPWYLGLFAFGMAAAIVTHNPGPRTVMRERVPWGTVALVFAGVFVALMMLASVSGRVQWLRSSGSWLLDVLAGLAAAALIIRCAVDSLRAGEQEGRSGPQVRLLEAPPVVALGKFSYSLYLTHAITLGVLHLALQRAGLSPLLQFGTLLTLGLAFALLVAYVFHALFERPFLRSH